MFLGETMNFVQVAGALLIIGGAVAGEIKVRLPMLRAKKAHART